MKWKIEVSVILPTYNESANIKPMVNRILANVKNIEIIVVDDDSPDKTWEVVNNMNKKGVRAIRRINERCLASAIAKGIDESKGGFVVWMDAVLVEDDFGISRDKLMKELAREGIGTRSFFVPMHKQPVFKKMGLVDKKRRYPVADYISKRGLYLPSGLTLKEEQIKQVCNKIRKVQRRLGVGGKVWKI